MNREPEPEIELTLDEPAAPEARASRWPRSRREWGRTLGVVTLLAVALVVFAVLTGDDSATRRAAAPSSPAVSGQVEILSGDATRAGDGPVLGEPVGMVIAIGGERRELLVIDLDTGDVSSLGRRAEPQLIVDGRLLVKDGWSRWESIDLADPAAEPVSPTAEPQLFAAAVPAEAGGVWFRHTGSRADQTWSRVDLDTGAVVERVTVPTPAGVISDSEGRPLSGPELVGSSTGGVYELQADGTYVQMLDDRLIAFDEDVLLVSSCDDMLACANRWVDRRTLVAMDRPAPDLELGAAYLRGDGALVAETYAGSDRVVRIFDTSTGVAVTTGDSRQLARTWVSPAGRYIARAGFDALLISEVAGSHTVAIDGVRIDLSVRVVWGYRPVT